MSRSLDVKLNDRQAEAFRYLYDTSTKCILYGGGGGAGKSWLAAFWLWTLMNGYRNLRFAVCRKQIIDAAATFTSTFFKVVNFYGDKPSRYKKTAGGIVNLATGSEIVYRSLIYIPTDSNYDRLGSLELTGVVIEEAQEITREAYEVIKTRVGRQLNKEYSLCPKVLMTCNPGANFLYTDFYKQKDDPVFNIDKKVVLATSADNLEYLPPAYVETLNEITDPIVKARILEGSWDFGDLDMATVIPMSLMVPCIGAPREEGVTRLGIDIGGPQGYSDATIVQIVHGNLIERPIVIPSKAFKDPPYMYDDWLTNQLVEIIESEGITDMKNVRVDACGIGQPIYENLRRRGYSCFPFRGDAKPYARKFNHNKYLNLRTQSYYELKEKFRLCKIKLGQNYSEQLLEDLSAVRYTETGGKIALEDKKFTRRRLGRSPDQGDALAMALLDLNSGASEKESKAGRSSASTVLVEDNKFSL